MSASNYVVPMPNKAPEERNAFAELIRAARKKRGWTQEQLIEESGISRSTIVRWEGGKAERPEPDQVRLVCRTLGIDPRQAAVALGYLDEEDIRPPEDQPPLPDEVREALDILADPRVPDAEKSRWIDYLKWIRDQSVAGGEHNRTAS